MVESLKEEQPDEDHKKGYCNERLDLSDEKKEATERALSDANTAINIAEQGIATLTEEIGNCCTGVQSSLLTSCTL